MILLQYIIREDVPSEVTVTEFVVKDDRSTEAERSWAADMLEAHRVAAQTMAQVRDLPFEVTHQKPPEEEGGK